MESTNVGAPANNAVPAPAPAPASAPAPAPASSVADASAVGNSVSVDSKETAWNETEYQKISGRYKNDVQEIAKAKWHADKELTRLQQEIASLRKNNSTSTSEQGAKDGAKPSAESGDHAGESLSDGTPSNFGTNEIAKLNNLAINDVMNGGKFSDATVKYMKELGFSDAQIKLDSEAKAKIIGDKIKTAQSYVDTPIAELKRFSETDGAFSDHELAIIQASLDAAHLTNNPDFYQILRVVERRYKSSAKDNITHGNIRTNTTGVDAYADPDEYYKDRRDYRYNMDKDFKQAVDNKYRRSNTDAWSDLMLKRGVKRR